MEVLERTAADWVFSQDVPSDVTVIVEGTAYALHKLPLASRSGWMRRTVSETADPSLSNIELADLPGGGEAFELAAKFCYGINFEIEATNVAALRCAAEYLEMSEDYAEENLASRTDTYLEEVVVKNLPKAVTVLQACDSLLPMAEELDIVSKCVDAIACKACKEQMTSSLSRSDLGSSGHLEELSSPGNFSQTPKRRTVEWWVEEISVLQIDNFKRVISAMKARGMRNDSIGSAVAFYAQKWMRGLLKKQAGQLVEMRNRARQMKAVHDLAATEEQEQQRRMLETLVSLLPAERGICSVNFLCAMLRVASYLEVSTPWRTEIEKRIGWQLEQAAVDDLLIPSFSQLSEPYFDLDTVSRIVGHFLHEEASGVDDDRGNTTDASAHADYSSGDGGSPPPQSAVMKVAKSLDSLLSEVAPDANLTVSKFVAFAELMPSYARVVDDGIYRAVDIYLKSHPGVSDLERKKVAGLMDCQKLSQEACTHAAQNDRLPVQVVVQVLYFEQMRLRNAKSEALNVEDLLRPGPGLSNMGPGLLNNTGSGVLSMDLPSPRKADSALLLEQVLQRRLAMAGGRGGLVSGEQTPKTRERQLQFPANADDTDLYMQVKAGAIKQGDILAYRGKHLNQQQSGVYDDRGRIVDATTGAQTPQQHSQLYTKADGERPRGGFFQTVSMALSRLNPFQRLSSSEGGLRTPNNADTRSRRRRHSIS
ncbi:hypothetical protein KP509_33G050400 [Ceratopteris richardii]|uniref:BTB/POZ domain-containing protein n=1 Tax=Ceratopteris richardii TaxID=49495 RepID=A0A8T2QQY5_CERRI|nr:hypothetical protein KP509_33G050400 [Ceratopteris richardii]